MSADAIVLPTTLPMGCVQDLAGFILKGTVKENLDHVLHDAVTLLAYGVHLKKSGLFGETGLFDNPGDLEQVEILAAAIGAEVGEKDVLVGASLSGSVSTFFLTVLLPLLIKYLPELLKLLNIKDGE